MITKKQKKKPSVDQSISSSFRPDVLEEKFYVRVLFCHHSLGAKHFSFSALSYNYFPSFLERCSSLCENVMQPETWTQPWSYTCLSRSLHHHRQKWISVESILNPTINTFYRTKIERIETAICHRKCDRHLRQKVNIALIQVTITSKRGSFERYVHSTTSQIRISRRRTGKKQPLSGFDTSNEAWTFTKIVISRGKHFHFCAGFPLGTYMHLSSGCLCLSHSSRDS